MVELNNNNKKT